MPSERKKNEGRANGKSRGTSKHFFAAYLLRNAILVLPGVGHLHTFLKPHSRAFAAQFSKTNNKCPINAAGGGGGGGGGHRYAWK